MREIKHGSDSSKSSPPSSPTKQAVDKLLVNVLSEYVNVLSEYVNVLSEAVDTMIIETSWRYIIASLICTILISMVFVPFPSLKLFYDVINCMVFGSVVFGMLLSMVAVINEYKLFHWSQRIFIIINTGAFGLGTVAFTLQSTSNSLELASRFVEEIENQFGIEDFHFTFGGKSVRIAENVKLQDFNIDPSIDQVAYIFELHGHCNGGGRKKTKRKNTTKPLHEYLQKGKLILYELNDDNTPNDGITTARLARIQSYDTTKFCI